jgi:predicted metal-binding membrane protein
MKSNSSDFYIVIIPILIMVSLAWIYLFVFANEMDMDMSSMDMSSMDMSSMDMNNDMNMDSKDMDMNMDMGSMDTSMDSLNKFSLFAMPMDGNWTVNDFIVMNLMWIIMMFAMMFPSSLMFLFLFYSMRSNMAIVKNPKLEIVLLSLMYFSIWTLFSMAACYLQYIFHNYSVVNMMGAFTSNKAAAITLIGAGLFQFSSFKDACLEKCRNPLAFIMGTKISSNFDVLKVGLLHGLYCLGCCWALMLILFVNGVMNMLWVVILTIAVLSEKIIPFEKLTSRFFGLILVFWGSYLIFI